jgi:type II restriction enzyme
MHDKKVFAADKDMKKLNDVFLNIVKIIREEIQNKRYDYYTGDIVKIFLNDSDTNTSIPSGEFEKQRARLHTLMLSNPKGTYGDLDIEKFLGSIYVTKLKAPVAKTGEFFGGTQDITMTVADYRSGITQTVGFSCKSDFGGSATLFNASADNTNFVYEIVGGINDSLMNSVNSMLTVKGKTAIGDRIGALKNAECDLKFISPSAKNAKRNLVLSGGTELPEIVGEALKYYYWVGEGKVAFSPICKAVEYVTANNIANYSFADIESIYYRKFSGLLYDMFTGMKLGKAWNGKSSVNGGYIVMKNDGDVLAYHSCIADEFKAFLLKRLRFETPSASRHKFMQIYKEHNKYYIKLNLQIRFI